MAKEYVFTITLHPWGDDADKGVIQIDPVALYGYWERKDGSEGGGLWFAREFLNGPLELIDYDGAATLPAAIVAALCAAEHIDVCKNF